MKYLKCLMTYTCCKCNTSATVEEDVPFDSTCVPRKNFPQNWHADGLGHFLCPGCYQKYLKNTFPRPDHT